jgi:hypothetical protein
VVWRGLPPKGKGGLKRFQGDEIGALSAPAQGDGSNGTQHDLARRGFEQVNRVAQVNGLSALRSSHRLLKGVRQHPAADGEPDGFVLFGPPIPREANRNATITDFIPSG